MHHPPQSGQGKPETRTTRRINHGIIAARNPAAISKGTVVIDSSAVRFLKRENGLPSGQIQGLAQDLDGRIWAATPSGLASYDGSRIHSFAKADGLRSHGLRALAAAPDGCLWIGSDAGYDLVRAGQIIAPHEDLADWPYGFVECIHCCGDSVWLGTAAGLVRWRHGKFQFAAHPKLRCGMITAVASGPDGTVWAASADGGLFFYIDDKWQDPPGLPWRELGDVLALGRGPANHIIAGGQWGFAEVSRSGDIVSRPAHADAGNHVTAILYALDTLWVAIDKELRGYARLPGSWQLKTTVLQGHFVNALEADDFGNLWAATESNGIAKISALRDAIRRIPLGDNQAIFSIAAGHRPNEIIAAGDHAAWAVDRSEQNAAREFASLSGGQVWDVLKAVDGAFFAATATGLKYSRQDGTVTDIGADHAVLSRPNRCLVGAGDDVYVGTLGGCAVVRPDLSIRSVPIADERPIGYVYTLATDTQGRLWAGTLGNGLWVKTADVFERFEHDLLNLTGNTYAIDAREDGAIVFIQDDRVFVIAPNGVLTLLAQSADPIAGWTVRWAPDGSIWTGSASGLTQYNSSDGHQMRQVIALLGLSNWEFTTSRSLYIDQTGAFYCGVNSGLLYVDSHAITEITQKPEVKLGSAIWDQTVPVVDGDTTVVPFARWTVLINVFASWYVDEEDLKFRFRLSGFDQHWRNLERRASVRFNSLPPGTYQLEAQAFNRLVGFGPVTNLMKIHVRPPRWANTILMAPFAGFNALRRIANALLRNRTLNDQNIELERIVQERTADLEQARRRLESLNKDLTTQSVTDQLTGISNRRHFDEKLAAAIVDAAGNGQPLSLILLDIDHFKPYNDIYGHARGDSCLSYVARKLVATLYRPADIAARYGGEEFAVILPGVGVGGAMSLAERLRRGVEELDLEHKGAPQTGHVTISVGVTTIQMNAGSEVDEQFSVRLIDSADKALYEAKDHGRNQCVFNSAAPSSAN